MRHKKSSGTFTCDSAIQLFWKKGYADTSLSNLGKATGVKKSSLYSEFKDKDDIFFESIKRYHDNCKPYDLLKAEPLGWNNVTNYFNAKINCKGQKGCFIAFTPREHSIIPIKVKHPLEKNSAEVFEMFLKNIKATGMKNPEAKATHLLTYAIRSSIKSNAMKCDILVDEIVGLVEMLK